MNSSKAASRRFNDSGVIALAFIGQADGVEAIGGSAGQSHAAGGGLDPSLGHQKPATSVARAGQQGKRPSGFDRRGGAGGDTVSIIRLVGLSVYFVGLS